MDLLKMLLLLPLTVTLFSATGSEITAADSLPPPCLNDDFHFDGITKDGDATVYGARGTIEPDDPYICNSTNSASAWVMVSAFDDGQSNGYVNYAQLGYRRQGAGLTHAGYRHFAQWTKSCAPNCGAGVSDYIDHISDAAPTSSTTYQVFVEASSGHMVMKYDSSRLGETGFDLATKWDAKYMITFAGETKSALSNMPGTSGDKVSFTQLQRYEQNGTINNISGSALSKIPNTSYACSSGCLDGYDRYTTASGGPGLKIWTP